MTTSNWIKLTPPPALPAPYDGKVHVGQDDKGRIGVFAYCKQEYSEAKYFRWVTEEGLDGCANIIAWIPIEPEPYVESK
jgi:hypothetical protein